MVGTDDWSVRGVGGAQPCTLKFLLNCSHLLSLCSALLQASMRTRVRPHHAHAGPEVQAGVQALATANGVLELTSERPERTVGLNVF